MPKKKKLPERSDFPPDAEVYLPDRENDSAAWILFSVFITVMWGVFYMVVRSKPGSPDAVGWVVIATWPLILVLLYFIQREEALAYTVIDDDGVEFRANDSSRIVRFRWDEIDSWRRFSTRFGPLIKLYSGNRKIKLSYQMPGRKRLEELIRQKNLPMHFPRGTRPDSFRVGLFMRVEGDNLIRHTLFGRKSCPLSELHVRRPLFRSALYDRSGKRFVSFPFVHPELMIHFDLLGWVLEQHGVDTKLL